MTRFTNAARYPGWSIDIAYAGNGKYLAVVTSSETFPVVVRNEWTSTQVAAFNWGRKTIDELSKPAEAP